MKDALLLMIYVMPIFFVILTAWMWRIDAPYREVRDSRLSREKRDAARVRSNLETW